MSRSCQLLLALLLTLNAKNLSAATLTAATAGAMASQLGADPWPWIVGSAGAAIAFLMRAPTTPKIALANGLISILCGGLGAPFIANIVSYKIDPIYANDLVYAAFLSVAWPFLVPLAMRYIEKWFGALPASRQEGQ